MTKFNDGGNAGRLREDIFQWREVERMWNSYVVQGEKEAVVLRYGRIYTPEYKACNMSLKIPET